MMHRWFWKPKSIFFTSLVFALALLVACGSAAQPAAEQQDPVKDTPKEAVKKDTPKDTMTEKKDPAKSKTEPVKDKADIVMGNVPPTIVPGAVSRPENAPAVAIPAGKRGGFINMNDYADVRQRTIAQSNVLNKNLSPLFNNLIEFNPETPDFNDLRCDLCTSWELAPDGITYTFHINPKATWWDGVPVTADDIVFSLEAQVNPDQFEILKGRSTSSGVNTSLYVETGSVRAIDDKTVEVVTKFPSGAFLTAIAIETTMIQAKHVVIGQGIQQGGKDLEALVGSGPFKFVKYIKEVSVEYERNPDYWKDGLPYIDGMKHFIMTDSGRIIAAYKTGQILTSNQYGYNLSNDEALRLDKDMDNLTVHWGPADFGRYVMMNTTKAPFDQREMRVAVHLALDRPAALEALAAGQGIQGYPLPSGEWYSYTDEEYANMPGYRVLANGEKDPADIIEAQALLKSIGADGPLKLTLNARNCCGYPDLVVLVKEQLQNAFGWDITIETLESGAGFDKYWAGDFTMAVQGGGLWSSDPDAIGSRYVRGTTMQWTGGGRGKRFVPPGFDEAFEAQQQELDQDKRKVLAQKMGDTILVDSGNPYVYWSRRYWAVEHRIQNFNFTSEGRAWEHVWCDPAC